MFSLADYIIVTKMLKEEKYIQTDHTCRRILMNSYNFKLLIKTNEAPPLKRTIRGVKANCTIIYEWNCTKLCHELYYYSHIFFYINLFIFSMRFFPIFRFHVNFSYIFSILKKRFCQFIRLHCYTVNV